MSLMHILPLLVLFMYTFLSGPSEPLYRMSRDNHFKEAMTTKRFAVPFFVKSSAQFEKDFPVGEYYRAQLELQVGMHLLNVLSVASLLMLIAISITSNPTIAITTPCDPGVLEPIVDT